MADLTSNFVLGMNVFSNSKYKDDNSSSMHHDYKKQILTETYVSKRILIIK